MPAFWIKWFRRARRYGIDRAALSSLKDLEKKIGYRFKNLDYLSSALKHRSCLQELSQSRRHANERLEFLGDAVLDLVSSEFFYHHFPDKVEGELTKMKSVMVSGSVLVRDAERLDLGEYLFLSENEERSGGRSRKSILEDAYEALLGAMYLDGGYRAVRRFITKGLLRDWEEVVHQPEFINYKSLLLEYAQGRSLPSPTYVLRDESGPDHAKYFEVEVFLDGEVMGKGEGLSKKVAEQMAACEAVQRLGMAAGAPGGTESGITE
jgi:ribonuclease-3